MFNCIKGNLIDMIPRNFALLENALNVDEAEILRLQKQYAALLEEQNNNEDNNEEIQQKVLKKITC